MTKKRSISNTKFCNYTITDVAKEARGPWSRYIISMLRGQPFCQLRKNVQLRLSKHGDVVIKTQAECLATYLSFWLLS